MIEISALSQLASYSGKLLVEHWPTKIKHQQLDQYLKLSRDSNPIHLSGATSNAIVPANLLLSIIPSVLQSHIEFAFHIQCFTVGYRDVKFRRQIELEDKIFVSIKLAKVKLISDAAYVDYEFRIDAANSRATAMRGVMSDFCVAKSQQ